ncbi:uncharacterized protein LOC121838046 [Ixodes scapularis]|uniref:uncharacterized protein LOC121838046 n=1 Tax=Ixodes scapularis TaxID=6945 RepID=UPI001A9D299A|nr:uncharacterized protein LOC121838046 [Ixodes scapularis]
MPILVAPNAHPWCLHPALQPSYYKNQLGAIAAHSVAPFHVGFAPIRQQALPQKNSYDCQLQCHRLSAHQKLKEIVLSKHLLRDIPSLSPSAQTFATECLHSTLLHFAPQLVHFAFRSMTARTYLAALHYNENGVRPQATTKEGKRRWVVKDPKAMKEAIAAMLKGHCTYEYVGELMAAVLEFSTVMPSYKAAAAHKGTDISDWERGRKAS